MTGSTNSEGFGVTAVQGQGYEGNVLVLCVTDTGVGAASAHGNATGASADAARGSGFGLAQVRARLSALYGATAVLEFSAQDGRGARTTARLPVRA